MANGDGNGRIEALKERQRQIQAALAAEQMKLVKQRQRETEKLQSIIGAAVLKAAELSPEFKLAVSQVALGTISDEKQRRFLAAHDWAV